MKEARILTSPLKPVDTFPQMTEIKMRWWHRVFLAIAPTVTYHTEENNLRHAWKYKQTPFGKVLMNVSTTAINQPNFEIHSIRIPEYLPAIVCRSPGVIVALGMMNPAMLARFSSVSIAIMRPF